MADVIATVQQESNLTNVIVQEAGLLTASTSLVNPAYVEYLSDIGNVDVATEGQQDGSVLVYKTATNKWTSTLLLDQQTMEAGEF